MTPDADFATLRGVLSDWTRDTREWKIAPRDAETALARVEAEVARLRQENERLHGAVTIRGNFRDEWRERAEAAEREVARLRDDDAVMEGFRAVRSMLQMRVGDKHAHAETFRRALLVEDGAALPGIQGWDHADNPRGAADCEHDYVRVYWSPRDPELHFYRCDKCGARSEDGVHPQIGGAGVTVDADLATLLEGVYASRPQHGLERDHDDYEWKIDEAVAAHKRVEAEIARLREMCAAHTQNEMELAAEAARLREGLRGLLSEAEQHGLWWLENRLRVLLAEDKAAFDPKGEFGKFWKYRGGAA